MIRMMGFGGGMFWLGLAPLIVWSFVWKGIALWKAGNHKQLGWFIALFLLNTIGILEIIYLIWFQKGKKGKKK